MNCKICNAVSTEIFEKRILNKYTSQYYQCNACDFIQTDEPIWLQEAYNNAITSLDIGLLNRNLRMLQFFALFLKRSLKFQVVTWHALRSVIARLEEMLFGQLCSAAMMDSCQILAW